MKRKLFTAAIAAACALGAAGVLAACGDKGHEHVYGADWVSDANGHWHVCTYSGCGATSDYAVHDWEEHEDYRECRVCDYRLNDPDDPNDPNKPDKPDDPDKPDKPDKPSEPDTGDAAFSGVSLSASGVLSWNKIKGASKYVIAVTYSGADTPVQYDIDKSKTSQDLQTLRDEGFPVGKTSVTLTAYEIDSVDIGGETVEQEVPMTGVSDSFRVTKLNGAYSLARLKYADDYITLDGFYSELATAADGDEYYLYELALKDNKPTRLDISKKIKAATGGAYKLYKTASGRDNETAADEYKSADLMFLSFVHGENMLYARAVKDGVTVDYDLCVYGLYTADINRYASTFTTENGLRTYTHSKLGDTLTVTERDIIPAATLYDGVETGKLGRTARYEAAEKTDLLLDLPGTSADGAGKVSVKYYFYDEPTVRADVAEYAKYSGTFGISESDYGMSLSANNGAKGEVTIPDVIVGKKVLSANFFMSEITALHIAEGATTFVATFDYCNYLKDIWLPSTITDMNEFAFGGDPMDILPTDMTVHCAFEKTTADNFPFKWNYIAGKTKAYNTIYGDSAPVTVGDIEYKVKGGGVTVVRTLGAGDVVIPDTVSINGRVYDVTAIAGVSSRGKVKIGKNVTEIAQNAFARSVENIELDGVNTAFAVSDGVLYSADISRVIVAETGVRSLFADENVQTIDKNAFAACVGAVLYVPYEEYNMPYEWNECNFDDVRLVYGVFDFIENGDYAFALRSDETAVLISYNGNAARLVVPDEINGYTVTEIANGAFAGHAELVEIEIPQSVTQLGNGLFAGCTALENITLPFLGESATVSKTFAAVTGLGNECAVESVTLTAATELHYLAFAGYANIRTISLPETLVSASGSAFDGCAALQYAEYDNALYLGNAGNNYLLLISAKSTDITACAIATETRIIADGAFKDCVALGSLVVPENVQAINYGALRGCTGLKSLTVPFAGTRRATDRTEQNLKLSDIFGGSVPSSLTSLTVDGCEHVSRNALAGMSGLTEIIFGDSVTGTGAGVFTGCENVTRIVFGARYVDMDDEPSGECVLSACPELAELQFGNDRWQVKDSVVYYYAQIRYVFPSISGEVVIPENVKDIGTKFANRSGITSLVIPTSVTKIAVGALKGCSGLTKITIPFVGTVKNPTSSSNNNFCAIFGTLTDIPSGLTEVVIAGGTKIYMQAFANCTMLRRVTIGASITDIGFNAFVGCKKNGKTTLQAIVLENRTGWTVAGTPYTAAQLTPSAVAQMMGDTHYDKVWKRTDNN